eukprot:9649475-Alexandrium_andersonii.AAC.1
MAAVAERLPALEPWARPWLTAAPAHVCPYGRRPAHHPRRTRPGPGGSPFQSGVPACVGGDVGVGGGAALWRSALVPSWGLLRATSR